MAYVSKEDKKELAPMIKKVLAKYGVKGTIKINHHSTLVVTLRKIPAGLFTPEEIDNRDVNVYHIGRFFEGTARKFLNELLDAMKGPKYFNNDDAMEIPGPLALFDHFDRSHYTDIKIGDFRKPVEVYGLKIDEPEEGKVYALTGGPGARCIANGNTWSEAEVARS